MLTGAAVLLLLFMLWSDYHDRSENLITTSLRFVKQDMSSLQREIQREYDLDNINEADQALSSRGVNTRYLRLAAFDNFGTVMHATQFALKGQPVTDVMPEFDQQRFNLLQQRNRMEIVFDPDSQRISAYFPLRLKSHVGEIRALRIGALFTIYDLSQDTAEIWRHILYSSLPVWLLALFLLLMLIGVLHYFITRPVELLVSTAREISKGNYGVQSRFKGNGEFARLGEDFNEMSYQLKNRFKQRQQAEVALRKSEQRFRTLIESAPIAFYETDALGNCLYVNKKWQELAGLTIEESLGKGWQRALYEKDRGKVSQLWYEHAEDEEPWDMEYRFCTPDGEISWLLGKSVALHDIDGQIIGHLGVNLDITELKQTEEALRRSQKMDAVGQLTGGIAHDFNNILGAILGNIELLELQTAVDEKTQKRFATIKHSTLRAVDLTKQLLSFSRTEETGATFININELIENMQTLLKHSLTPQIEIKLHLAEDLWLTNINPGGFEDALLNLAINARDAMSGEGNLSIETSNCSLDDSYCSLHPGVQPGDYVELAVSDNGCGIKLEEQERVFEPFYSTKPVGKGTGLGLSMVFGFANRSHGSIKIYSEPDIGTTFRLYLPRAKGMQQILKNENQQVMSMPRGKESVLVVDDEILLLEVVSETLKEQGYHVFTATDGKQALEILANEPNIELLFSDVVMPGGINGYQLAEQACRTHPDLKVMLTSGYTEMAIARNGQAQFNATLLSKPYTLMKMTQRVREILDQR